MNSILTRGRLVCAVVCAILSVALRAEVKLAPLFGEGMVLQRGQPIRVWGSADEGEKVSVEFAGQAVSVTTGPTGSWRVTLPAQAASAEGRELHVTGTNVLCIGDVLVGDVWICSGQSNMEFMVKDSLDGKREVATANQPLVREIKIGRQLADQPMNEFSATAWRRTEPGHVGGFTAVGYYFAKEMVRETGVPVGIINCTWSGTPIEPWMGSDALAAKAEFAVVARRWNADLAAYPERRKVYEDRLATWSQQEEIARANGVEAHQRFLGANRRPRPPAGSPDHPYPSTPSAIYNGMVYPLRHAAIRGVLWYQGEANAVRATEYASLFQSSIRGWRDTFGQPELPFYWVQIANFIVDSDWPRLREAQGKAMVLPATGQAVAIDIGDPDDIHPANKQEVGRRLSLIALAKLEQRPIEYSGPRVSSIDFAGGAARVNFQHADGLQSKDGPVTGLELAGDDRVFHSADGIIQGDRLTVSAAMVPQPVAVRYAWSASPRANLYNRSGLPASPFRSDDW